MMIVFILVAISAALWTFTVCFSRRGKDNAITFALLAVIFSVITLPMVMDVALDVSAYDAHCYEVRVTRSILMDELYKYDEMREDDVSASLAYLTVREKIINFNTNVIYAKEHNNIWAMYLFSAPEYATVDIIPLEVG